MCFIELAASFLKEWGLTSVVLGVVVKFFIDQKEKRNKYKDVLRLFRDEVRDFNVSRGDFDEAPNVVMNRNPASLYSVSLLLTDYFGQVRKKKELMNGVWNFNVSLQKYNSFVKTYNQIVWSNIGNVDVRRKMFNGMEVYLSAIRADREVLLPILEGVFKEMEIE